MVKETIYQSESKVEMRTIKIANLEQNALFDTGAAQSFVGLGLLLYLKKNPTNLKNPKEFVLAYD
jgi:hypothetical protein